MLATQRKAEIMSIDPADFRAAMREMAGAVSIIAAGCGSRRRGMTATAVCSLSAQPPTLLVCINKDTECHKAIVEHGAFSVNVLGANAEGLANRFAGREGTRGLERFAAGRWSALATGAPVLEDAVAVFDCTLRQSFDGGTHSVFIGDVSAVSTQGGQAALVYRAGRFAAVD